MSIHHSLIALGILFAASGLAAQSTKVSTENIEGVSNLRRLETTVACAGAVKTDAIPAIKKMGFASVVNLRMASEPGANIEEEGAAAKAVGLNYFHIPFNG